MFLGFVAYDIFMSKNNMEGEESSLAVNHVPRIMAGENEVQYGIKNTNDVSKGWPPPKSRVQRSSSIRFANL